VQGEFKSTNEYIPRCNQHIYGTHTRYPVTATYMRKPLTPASNDVPVAKEVSRVPWFELVGWVAAVRATAPTVPYVSSPKRERGTPNSSE